MERIARALVSVSDKTGVVDFCRSLTQMGVEILSTGGTAKTLREAGVPVRDVSEHTGFPEMLDGRVKTLHPKIHGGILYIRANSEHRASVEANAIKPIDMVVCNLYPFEKTVAKQGVSLAEAIENIDIGGPSMVRAAAKNSADVAVLVSPDQYSTVMAELQASGCTLSSQTRFELAVAAFRHTAHYDAAISKYLAAWGDEEMPPLMWIELDRSEKLREGVNQRRTAALYATFGVQGGPAEAAFISGWSPSAQDVINLGVAGECARIGGVGCACGVRRGLPVQVFAYDEPSSSLRAVARECGDKEGNYLGLATPIGKELAQVISESFANLEGLAAPNFNEEAIAVLGRNRKWGERARLMCHFPSEGSCRYSFRPLDGGFVVEQPEGTGPCDEELELATSGEPTDADWMDASLAWELLDFFPSASCVLVNGRALVAASASETEYPLAAKSAIWRGGKGAKGAIAAIGENPLDEAVLSVLFSAGIRGAVIPGNSRIDDKMIAIAKAHSALLFTTGKTIVKY